MGRAVEVSRVRGALGCALTVDVEEWYHNCLVPSYVQPRLRPDLPVELDRLLPELLGLLAEAGCRATFFVLGEVAERLPERVREMAGAGHEVASHGFHHLRACGRPASSRATSGGRRRCSRTCWASRCGASGLPSGRCGRCGARCCRWWRRR